MLQRCQSGKLENEPRVELGHNDSNELEEACVA